MRRLAVFTFLFLAVALPALAGFMDEVPRITVDELKSGLDRGAKTVILDVRSRSSYGSSGVMIKGAVRIPPDELNDRAAELPPGREIVTYCT